MDIEEVKQRLYDYCLDFMTFNNVSCAETIYQSDRIQMQLDGFASDIFDILGINEEEEDND
jgi:hypothetical protein